jgi:hypothetical protein
MENTMPPASHDEALQSALLRMSAFLVKRQSIPLDAAQREIGQRPIAMTSDRRFAVTTWPTRHEHLLIAQAEILTGDQFTEAMLVHMPSEGVPFSPPAVYTAEDARTILSVYLPHCSMATLKLPPCGSGDATVPTEFVIGIIMTEPSRIGIATLFSHAPGRNFVQMARLQPIPF